MDIEKKAGTGVTPKGAFFDDSSSSRRHSSEKDDVIGTGTTVQLQRRLQSRHLQMIAIGGTIGTGLCKLHSARSFTGKGRSANMIRSQSSVQAELSQQQAQQAH